MNTYGTLEELREYLTLASQDNVDDKQLLSFLRSASRSIDRFCYRTFYPQRETLIYDMPEHNQRTLRFDRDVLAMYGLSHLNGATEFDSAVYWLRTGDKWSGLTPYDRIELDVSSGSVFNYSGTPQRAIYADVLTGYHEDYGNAWVLTNSSLTTVTDTTASYLYVTGSNLENEWGSSSGIQTGAILKIGDEFLYVISGIDSSTIHVKRAINGTSSSAHAASTAVYSFQPEEDVRYSTVELAAFQYLSSTSPRTGRVAIPTFGAAFTIDVPESWPPQTFEKLRRLRRKRVYHF